MRVRDVAVVFFALLLAGCSAGDRPAGPHALRQESTEGKAWLNVTDSSAIRLDLLSAGLETVHLRAITETTIALHVIHPDFGTIKVGYAPASKPFPNSSFLILWHTIDGAPVDVINVHGQYFLGLGSEGGLLAPSGLDWHFALSANQTSTMRLATNMNGWSVSIEGARGDPAKEDQVALQPSTLDARLLPMTETKGPAGPNTPVARALEWNFQTSAVSWQGPALLLSVQYFHAKTPLVGVNTLEAVVDGTMQAGSCVGESLVPPPYALSSLVNTPKYGYQAEQSKVFRDLEGVRFCGSHKEKSVQPATQTDQGLRVFLLPLD